MRCSLFISLLLLTYFNLPAQNVIKPSKISNYNKINLYGLLEDSNFHQAEGISTTLLSNHSYLDSVNIDTFRYQSDGIKVFSYITYPKYHSSKLPVIIFNRGGNHDFSNISLQFVLHDLARIASKGFAVVASTYRGNSKSAGTDEFCGKDLDDVLNLIEVLSEIPFADTGKIGLFGWSRGGLMSYIALTRTKRLKSAVVGGAPSNMFSLIKVRPEMETGVLQEMVPNYNKEKNYQLYLRSPIFWFDKIAKIPILIIHGEDDTRVPVSQAINMFDSLKTTNKMVDITLYKGNGHSIEHDHDKMIAKVINWFNVTL